MAWDCEARRVFLVSQFTDLSEMRRLGQRPQCGHPKVHAGAGEHVWVRGAVYQAEPAGLRCCRAASGPQASSVSQPHTQGPSRDSSPDYTRVFSMVLVSRICPFLSLCVSSCVKPLVATLWCCRSFAPIDQKADVLYLLPNSWVTRATSFLSTSGAPSSVFPVQLPSSLSAVPSSERASALHRLHLAMEGWGEGM